MTSCEPLADLILRPLREAEPGSYSRLNRVDQYDLDQARNRGPGQRLHALDQVQMVVEALGMRAPSRQPISHHDLRM